MVTQLNEVSFTWLIPKTQKAFPLKQVLTLDRVDGCYEVDVSDRRTADDERRRELIKHEFKLFATSRALCAARE